MNLCIKCILYINAREAKNDNEKEEKRKKSTPTQTDRPFRCINFAYLRHNIDVSNIPHTRIDGWILLMVGYYLFMLHRRWVCVRAIGELGVRISVVESNIRKEINVVM